jgi:phosphoribosyl 1,2-cyclic phosphodiesterase
VRRGAGRRDAAAPRFFPDPVGGYDPDVHVQVLSSGSGGNSALVRAGDEVLLVDAGLPPRELSLRLEAARIATRSIRHVAVTHGHLDHARSAGVIAARADATLWATERLQTQRALARATRIATLRERQPAAIGPGLRLIPVRIPHDAEPTFAFRIEHETAAGCRVAVILTDMGRPDAAVARALSGAHLLILEFNHDRQLLEDGPYPEPLKRRVGGDLGHLSNDQAAEVLAGLAGPELHTLVLAHLSETNTRPELARESAARTLGRLGRGDVKIEIAEQDCVLDNLAV